MTNAHSARRWALDALGDEAAIARHFVAVSTNADAVEAFGIDTANMFGFWDWVGGRYSMDSAIGLSTMIAVGPENFREMLAGFHAMDEHFRSAPLERNLPVLMGLLSHLVQRVLRGADRGRAALRPVPEALPRLPAAADHGEQRQAGDPRRGRPSPTTRPAPIVWGEPGTNGQHSFYQLIHQGTRLVPCDFIGFAHSLNPLGEHHDILMSNVFAQAEALAFGKTAAEVKAEGTADRLVPHRTFPGNRPSNVLLAERLTPAVLGALVALYEHSVFVAGRGLGHRLVRPVGRRAGQGAGQAHRPGADGRRTARTWTTTASTNALIRRYRQLARTAGLGMKDAPLPIRLVLSDLDGTLVDHAKVLTARAVAAVGRLRAAGILFAVTTGRPPRGAAMIDDALHLDTPVAGFNGGLVVDPGGKVVASHRLAVADARVAIERIRSHGLDPWLYTAADWCVTDATAPHVAREQATVGFAPVTVDELEGHLRTAVKIVGVSDDPERLVRCEQDVQAACGGRVSAKRSQPYYLDVTHPHATKGFVLEMLAERYGIPAAQIATIGDGPNDVLMFARSGLSIAMGNAAPEVQQAADRVTASCDDEGFARAMAEIVLPRA